MNSHTPNEVLRLPLSSREEDHRSRSRRGFNVYLSRYFLDFKVLTDDEKWEKLNEHENNNVLEDESIDSVDTNNFERNMYSDRDILMGILLSIILRGCCDRPDELLNKKIFGTVPAERTSR